MATPEQLSACTLEGSELVARVHAWQQVASRAISRRVEATRIIATYPNDAQLLEQLRELIDAEAACCSFLKFSLEEGPDSIVTELRFPQETPAPMRTMILQLIGATQRHTGAAWSRPRQTRRSSRVAMPDLPTRDVPCDG